MRDNLINKQYKQYSSLSRYQTFPVYYSENDDKYIYGTTAYLNENTASQVYTVRAGDTYDSISLVFYGNPLYYWVICSFNRIDDPFEKPKIGTKIRIPTISTLEFEDI